MARICDYEGSNYRTDFWDGQNRDYENQVERVAMANMLPPQGRRLIEIGAGFGRLADLYDGYEQVVLLDYARTQLEEAQNYLGESDRFTYIVADVYNLPFVDNLFDALTMVRVMHHLVKVPAALQELHRIITPNGIAVIEHASKLHLKSLARWLLRAQDWNPLDPAPVEFVELNFDFHPAWMRQQFEMAGLTIQNTRALSYYRLKLLKRLIPIAWLVKLDSLTQPTGNWWQFSPSIFLQAIAEKPPKPTPTGFFCCPNCRGDKFSREALSHSEQGELLICDKCHYRWSFKAGIYDFKTPAATA